MVWTVCQAHCLELQKHARAQKEARQRDTEALRQEYEERDLALRQEYEERCLALEQQYEAGMRGGSEEAEGLRGEGGRLRAALVAVSGKVYKMK